MKLPESPERLKTTSLLRKLRITDRPQVLLLLVVLAALAAYSNTLEVPFMFDDELVFNPIIKDISNIPKFIVGYSGRIASRPLLLSTFALNYYFEGLHPWSYHVLNLILHIINGILIYFLVSMTGRHLGYNEKSVRLAGVLSSLFFTLHPAQTQGVTYVVSRSMLFATSFYLAGMILFLKAVTATRRKSLFVIALFVTSLLGMGSRESFVTFPAMLFLYDIFFVSGFRLREALKHYKAYVPVVASLGYLAFLVLNNTYDKGSENPGAGIPHMHYFLTEFNVHWTYLRFLLFPINHNIDYDYPIATTIFEFPTLLFLLAYVGLWATALVTARRKPVFSFAILWFLITLFPISFLVAFLDLRLDDVIWEHRLYLPSVGLFIAAGTWISFYIGRLGSGKARIAMICIVAILALALSVGTYARNAVWGSEITFWEDNVKKSPLKSRPHFNLGKAYNTTGQFEKAIEQYSTSLRLGPDQAALANNNLGIIYSTQLESPEKAMEHFRRAIKLDPFLTEAYFNLGMLYLDDGRPDKARGTFELLLMIDPNYPQAIKWLEYAREMDGQGATKK